MVASCPNTEMLNCPSQSVSGTLSGSILAAGSADDRPLLGVLSNLRRKDVGKVMTPIQRLARMRESFETSKSLSFDEPRLTGYLRGVRLALSRNRISKGQTLTPLSFRLWLSHRSTARSRQAASPRILPSAQMVVFHHPHSAHWWRRPCRCPSPRRWRCWRWALPASAWRCARGGPERKDVPRRKMRGPVPIENACSAERGRRRRQFQARQRDRSVR